MKKLFASLFVLFFTGVLQAVNPAFSNLQPRTDEEGLPVDVHAGGLFLFNNCYYWYGTTSYTSDVQGVFRCYSSTGLQKWKKGDFLLKNKPAGTYYRAQMMYVAKSKQFVLWFRWCPAGGADQLGVAVSAAPNGPFRLLNASVKTTSAQASVRDFSLFQDEDGAAYLIYTTSAQQRRIEPLRPDGLSSTLKYSEAVCPGLNAGAMFKHNKLYYLLLDESCGKESAGGLIQVLKSDNPTTGFAPAGVLNKYPGSNIPSLTDGILTPGLYTTVRKQRDGAFAPVQLEFPADTLVCSMGLIQFTGNRKAHANDSLGWPSSEAARTPAFEIQYWKNGYWIPLRTSQQAITSSVYTMIQCRFDAVKTRRVRLLVQRTYPSDLYLNELEVNLPGDKILSGIQPFMVQEDAALQPTVVPGLQTGVAVLPSAAGTQILWLADLRGSSSTAVKGCDYQYWSSPLEFDPKGDIEPFRWVDACVLSAP